MLQELGLSHAAPGKKASGWDQPQLEPLEIGVCESGPAEVPRVVLCVHLAYFDTFLSIDKNMDKTV
jgi:hypothetical protein